MNSGDYFFLSIPQAPHWHHINAVIPLIREIVHFGKNNHKQLKTNELQKYKFSHLGTWRDFIWELGTIFVWELGKNPLGELAKFSKHKRIMRHSIKLLYFCLLK